MKFVYLNWFFEGLQYKALVDGTRAWDHVKGFIKTICYTCRV